MSNPKIDLLDALPCLRNCGGTVEIWEVQHEDGAHDFKVRYIPEGKSPAEGYMGIFLTGRIARAVAKNWAEGADEPPWAHLVDTDWGRG